MNANLRQWLDSETNQVLYDQWLKDQIPSMVLDTMEKEIRIPFNSKTITADSSAFILGFLAGQQIVIDKIRQASATNKMPEEKATWGWRGEMGAVYSPEEIKAMEEGDI